MRNLANLIVGIRGLRYHNLNYFETLKFKVTFIFRRSVENTDQSCCQENVPIAYLSGHNEHLGTH